MKKTLITISIALFAVCRVFAQDGAAINSSGAAADPSAMLDVSSHNKGFLTPRMSETERLAISNPARGLLVYQINNDYGFWFYDGSSWQKANAGDNLGNHIATDSLNMANYKIKNLAACTQNLDAANKEYVDNAIGSVSAGGGGSTVPSMISDESLTAYTYAQAVQYCDNLVESGYNDWRLPDAYEIQYFAGIPSASANFLWTKTHSPIDYQANQNFISVKLDDGRWRNGDEMVSPIILNFYSPNINPTTPMEYRGTITPTITGNWLKVTDISIECMRGYARAKFYYPNGTSTYSPTYTGTSTTLTEIMKWSNIQTPILVTAIDLESQSSNASSGSYNHRARLTITGFEIAPLQKEGATLNCRCVR